MGLAFEQFADKMALTAASESSQITPDEAVDPGAVIDEDDPEAAAQATAERLVSALESIARDTAQCQTAAISTAASAFAAAAATLLPGLARAGFAARAAEIAVTVAGRGNWPNICLSHAQGDGPAITAGLSSMSPEASDGQAEITLIEDARLSPGCVTLSWPDGGALIDNDAIAAAILEDFNRQLAGLTPKEEQPHV